MNKQIGLRKFSKTRSIADKKSFDEWVVFNYIVKPYIKRRRVSIDFTADYSLPTASTSTDPTCTNSGNPVLSVCDSQELNDEDWDDVEMLDCNEQEEVQTSTSSVSMLNANNSAVMCGDLIAHICSYLELFDVCKSVCKVCRLWYTFSWKGITSIHIKHSLSVSVPKTQVFIFPLWDNFFQNVLLSKFLNIETLSFEATDSESLGMIRNFHVLEMLKKYSHSMKRLVLKNWHMLTPSKGFLKIPRYCPGLKHLTIKSCQHIDDSTLLEIVQAIPNLQELAVENCQKITAESLKKLITTPSSLKFLKFVQSNVKMEETFDALANNAANEPMTELPSLERLKLIGSNSIKWSHFNYIRLKFPNLMRLSVQLPLEILLFDASATKLPCRLHQLSVKNSALTESILDWIQLQGKDHLQVIKASSVSVTYKSLKTFVLDQMPAVRKVRFWPGKSPRYLDRGQFEQFLEEVAGRIEQLKKIEHELLGLSKTQHGVDRQEISALRNEKEILGVSTAHILVKKRGLSSYTFRDMVNKVLNR